MSLHSLHDFAHHNRALFLVGVFCVWISLSMIVRMWLKYPGDSFLKKAGWSLILCVPFFGWLFYAGMYSPPSENSIKAPVNADAVTGGVGSH